MESNSLKTYLKLREQLSNERNELQERLRQIDAALGVSEARSAPAESFSRKATGRRGRPAGGLSLREAVQQVIKDRVMTKEEILEGIKNLGYRFATNNPMNSLGVILYGKKPKFRNENGRFSLQGAPATKASSQTDNQTVTQGKQRIMSPAARARIAAAQRARWAKAKQK